VRVRVCACVCARARARACVSTEKRDMKEVFSFFLTGKYFPFFYRKEGHEGSNFLLVLCLSGFSLLRYLLFLSRTLSLACVRARSLPPRARSLSLSPSLPLSLSLALSCFLGYILCFRKRGRRVSGDTYTHTHTPPHPHLPLSLIHKHTHTPMNVHILRRKKQKIAPQGPRWHEVCVSVCVCELARARACVRVSRGSTDLRL